MDASAKQPLVRYLDATQRQSCPYGDVARIVTGGAGGVANVHVVRVTRGAPHFHQGYDEVYYVLSGTGRMTIGAESHSLRPGAAAVIPAGVSHSLESDAGQTLEFVIFGSPGMDIADERARPRKT
jgi:mannose-6-phosphate isomerase-like protein (cupin superfamily)